MRIGTKISLLVVGSTVLATAALTFVSSLGARRQYIAGIDARLTAAAAALPQVIGSSYLQRAGAGSLTPAEYDATVRQLNDVADRSGVFYLYVFAKDGEQIVHLATSASEQERAAGEWATFREPYQEPPEELLATFSDGLTRFAEYTDEFGSFRSVFVRQPDVSGAPAVVGVDVAMGDIRGHLAQIVGRSLAIGGLVAVLAGVGGTLIARRIARPLLELSSEVEAWSRRDFAGDATIREHLQALSRRHRDESGDLAARFIDVQDRLEAYLAELTATTAAKQKIENQLEVAKTIQESLLPTVMPRIENFQISGWCQPADQTGGDYFDCLELPNGDWMLTIGDVTGHGIGPALVTAASRAYARATVNPNEALEATITRLNELLHGDLKGERFVTMVACLLDPRQRHMKVVAAGHGPIMFYSRRRDAVDVSIESQGFPLGIVENVPYEQPMELQFEPGDVLVLVSDGFFEWLNVGGEAFGTDRLVESVHRSCRDAPDQIIERLRRDVSEFNKGTPQEDDTTALIVRCVG
jgi:sigma-B regulation protein RsbU (phosphoserine phosphatase)